MDLLPLPLAAVIFLRASTRRSCSATSSLSRSSRAIASSVPHRCAPALGKAANAHSAASKETPRTKREPGIVARPESTMEVRTEFDDGSGDDFAPFTSSKENASSQTQRTVFVATKKNKNLKSRQTEKVAAASAGAPCLSRRGVAIMTSSLPQRCVHPPAARVHASCAV